MAANGIIRVLQAGVVWVRVRGVRIYSCYCSPKALDSDFVLFLHELEASVSRSTGRVVVAGDFNAKSSEWESPITDERGRLLADTMARLNLHVLSTGSANTFVSGNTGSIVDVAFADEDTIGHITNWEVLSDTTLSDHQYISHELRDTRTTDSTPHKNELTRWAVGKLDTKTCEETFKFECGRIQDATTETELCKETTAAITRACEASMPRKGGVRRKPQYWWNDEISELRRICTRKRRELCRTGRRHRSGHEDDQMAIETPSKAHKEARRAVTYAIRRSKKMM
ncbi:uncharacterized protein LOC143912423 [Arctopsyche grandis]|uniref:uncharacterized protein LOC143912423 n=1 Tax=Arctopsyche grandis TaxID=121162 RepID=UPI00406D94EC